VSGTVLEIQTNDKVNNNIMAADAGSQLDIENITVFQDGEGLGGTLLANEGNIRLYNATIQGGQYLAVGAGVLNTASGSSLLSGVTLNGPSFINAGHTITVDADGLVNNGLMQMNTTGSSADAILLFTDDTDLTGTGEIRMRTAFFNTQIVSDLGFTVNHTADHTIRGVGNIYAAMDNQGTVIADSSVSVSGNVLVIEGQDKTNSGVMSALSSSILELTTMNLTQTGAGHSLADEGLVRFIGSSTLTGGRIEASGAGSFIVDGPATFVDVTNNAPGVVNGGDTLTVSGDGLVNNGFVSVNPNQFSADGIIAFPADGFFNTAGGGEVRLEADFGNSQIDGPGIVTNGPGHTISGLGTIDTEFVNDGIIAPGKDAIGTLDASGDVTFGAGGSMTIEVGNANQSDRFAITGTANLGGTLDVVTIPAFEIGNQIDYTILTAGNVVGTFDTENLIVDGNLITRILYEPTQVRLVTRCIADVNLDGMVTPTDFTAWVGAYNTSNPVADQNLDGMVTPTDFSAWVGNFNAGCP
ncbi:MAG: GC-type dockerin domain-anchored protein, partial [Phycisphaerales bacterium JB061]